MLKYNLAKELVAVYSLCENRHDYPVKDALLGEIITPLAPQKMELEVKKKLQPLVALGLKQLIVYISGSVTSALVVYSVALKLHIRDIIFMQYDAVNGDYQPYVVASYGNIIQNEEELMEEK